MTAPVLAFPRSDAEFIVDCDASDYGLRAVISQEQDGSERVIAYASRVLDNRERRYSTTKKEMLGMVYAFRHFRHYLYGRPFTVRTDHNALKWFQSFKEPEGKVARWLELLAQYDYKIEHRPGRKHQNADALSRKPLVVAEDTDQITQTNAVGSSTSTWVPSWTVTNLRSSQAGDPDLKKILAWKQNQTSQPSFREIEGTSKATRSLWAQWNRLQLENGVLYRRWETDDGHATRLQLVLPRSMVSQVLSALHDAPSAGHLGVNKTLERERENVSTGMVSSMTSKIGANSAKSAAGGSPRSSQEEHPLSAAVQVTHLRGLLWTSWVRYQLQNLVRSTSWLLETTLRSGPRHSHSRIKRQRQSQKSW